MQNLLHQPKASLIKTIAQVMEAIDVAAPIPAAHKRGLPHDIRDLSALLTEERGGMARPYWAAKNFFSAYIHYFLPWNLYRLSWLLPSLPLSFKAGNVILDLGSGPLTLPLALWCARPELRDVPLHFICTDIANQPMEQGLAIFTTLTKGHSPWSIECVKAPIETALTSKLTGRVDCIMAGNVLNELQPAKGQTLNGRIAAIVHACSRKLQPEGTILFVEPGTRLGGKMIIMAREAGRMLGLPIIAPCPHEEHCPLAKNLEREERMERRPRPRGRQMASLSNMWCHFSFPVEGAPARLARLTAAAKFDRRSLALSCLMMKAGEETLSVKDAALLSELDELEALYAETLLSDDLPDNLPGGLPDSLPNDLPSSRPDDLFADKASGFKGLNRQTGHYGRDARALEDGAGEVGNRDRKSFSGRKDFTAEYGEHRQMPEHGGRRQVTKHGEHHQVTKHGERHRAPEGRLSGDIPEPPLWARIISGPIRLPKEPLPARYGCSAAGLVLVRRCERIPYGAAVKVTWDRQRWDEKSGALLVDMVDVGVSDESTGEGRQEGRSRETAKPASGLRSYFSRPQKMRERYGGLPQSLSQPKGASEKRPAKPKGAFPQKASSKNSFRGKDTPSMGEEGTARSSAPSASAESSADSSSSAPFAKSAPMKYSGKHEGKHSTKHEGKHSAKRGDKHSGKYEGTHSSKPEGKHKARRAGKSADKFGKPGGEYVSDTSSPRGPKTKMDSKRKPHGVSPQRYDKKNSAHPNAIKREHTSRKDGKNTPRREHTKGDSQAGAPENE